MPSELNAAYLYAQLEQLDEIQSKRIAIHNFYKKSLIDWASKYEIQLPNMPEYGTNNGHMFYVLCKNEIQRSDIINHLKKNEILSVFHYLSLHMSPFFTKKHDGRLLKNSDRYMNTLLRLPLFYELEPSQVTDILISYGE